MGVACSLKYSALILPIFDSSDSLCTFTKDARHPMFLIGLCVTGTIFYCRNLVETGNPLFPMMYELFGGSGWDSWRAMAYQHTLDNYGMGRSRFDYIFLPFRLFVTMDMTRFFQGSIGIGWLLMIGISLWQYKREASNKWMWGLLTGWFVFWALQVQQVRFFLPILPLLTMVCIPIVSKWKPKSWGFWIFLSFDVVELYPLQSIVSNQQGQVYWSAKDKETVRHSDVSVLIASTSRKLSCIHTSQYAQYKRYG